MVYVVPLAELELKDVIQARREAANLLTEAIRARGKNPADYVIRDILPKTDLGLANEEWKISYTAAYTWESKVSFTVPEDKFVVFYGIALNSKALGETPKTLALKFYKDVMPIEVIQVENLYAHEVPVGFFTPLVWRESEGLKIEFYGREAGDDYVMLRGLVAELRKKTVA